MVPSVRPMIFVYSIARQSSLAANCHEQVYRAIAATDS